MVDPIVALSTVVFAPYLHIIFYNYIAYLANFGDKLPSGLRGKAKTISPNNGTRMDNNVATQHAIKINSYTRE
jgi:hypothetical protein